MKKFRHVYETYDLELLRQLRPNTEAIARKFTSPFTTPEDLRILADALDRTASALRTIAKTYETKATRSK